ncbi:MAG TPA: hypothetical protein DDW94_05070 [Deltaproteobacteria bacterium]|nr:MAG: hypothetical protein A2Z79_11040 [Deltaproteobacteria bacterium GWA2_55_82]OGQ64424.1 MAG: hypothetical protein A3I81_03025 [Deltaproteobacteria bacterium RIFCSPLOWO2_02_FULL_55_12]OIJ72804.1 MAG: hypothetical protein A2V21_300165 [Deltaproteobacteria bacterium GWC2_55_46]HBG46345.1 hypothetical protein [Deltaproteobacteria bacterium]HCY11580.1 hypothetical protein [Deltaproteobacteria bacterium]
MTNKTRTTEELDAYLKSLLQFLAKSTQAYDMGFDGECQRMAVAVRAIVEDVDGTGSLLDKLGMEIQFNDNSPDYDPKLALPMSGLALYSPTNKDKNRYVPRLGRNPGIPFRKVSFEQWLTKLVIIDEEMGVRISRKEILFAVSNTIPKAAARPVLNNEFSGLIQNSPLAWVDQKAGLRDPVALSMQFASTRHIAFELILSFEEQKPQYFEGLYQQNN